MKSGKNILFISYYYPPSGQVGAKRIMFLAKYFEQCGENVHILTTKEKYYTKFDSTLSEYGITHRVKMIPNYPIKENNILNKFLNKIWVKIAFVEPYMGFILPAIIKGISIIRNLNIDVLISTYPIQSNLIVGYLLKLLTKKKLFFDYRDPWTIHKMRPYESKLIKRLNIWLEKQIINKVDVFIFCTDIMRKDFLRNFGLNRELNVEVVTNGFEMNNFNIKPVKFGNRKVNMIYAGNFYGAQRKLSTIAYPLSVLVKEGFINSNNFCFHILSEINDENIYEIEKLELKNLIQNHGVLDYKTTLSYLKASDILLLISGTDVFYAIPFKFFDYLSVKKTIFAIAPVNSAVNQILNSINCGEFVDIKNTEDIIFKLKEIIFKKKRYNYSGIENFTWDMIGGKYSKLINRFLNE